MDWIGSQQRVLSSARRGGEGPRGGRNRDRGPKRLTAEAVNRSPVAEVIGNRDAWSHHHFNANFERPDPLDAKVGTCVTRDMNRKLCFGRSVLYFDDILYKVRVK